MSRTGLAIVECRWWTRGNDSVRPLFETLAGIVEDNPHAVRYDMFADRSSLESVFAQVASVGDYHSIYVASHGNEQHLGALGDALISRTELRNSVRATNTKAHIKGIYFGSCLIANRANAEFLLKDRGTKLLWVAGYAKTVDWVDSSAIDMIFWSKYLHARKANKSKKGPKAEKSEVQMMLNSSKKMRDLVPNVFTQMGFNIYYLDNANNVNAVW